MMVSRPEPDDVEVAFRELIAREWPTGTPGADDLAEEPGPDVVEPSPPPEPSLFDWIDPNPEEPDEPTYTLDHVEPDDPGDDWRPDPAPLGSRFRGMSPTAVVGTVLLVASLLSVLLIVVAPAARTWAGVVAIGGFAVGLLLLLSRLPRNRPPGDGGAVV